MVDSEPTSSERRDLAWPHFELSAWRDTARAELDGGDVDALATQLDAAVSMAPLYTHADLPADAGATTRTPPSARPTRLAMTCADVSGDGVAAVDGYELVRVTDRSVQAALANGETEVVRRLDPHTVALTLNADAEGMAALSTLERAGLPHVVVLALLDGDEVPAPARALALSLATVADVLGGLGTSPAPRPAALAARLCLPVHVGTDVVTQIAKVRAARWLWHTLMTAFEVEPDLRHARIWAKASSLCWSAIDPELNLGRAALQGFAATASGCDAFEPLLFDPQRAASESCRLAANQHRLLLHEGELMRVHDPAAGSFAIESLTRQIAASAWAMLQAGRDAMAPLDHRPEPVLVGTNRFADPTARVTQAPPGGEGRPAKPFEDLRRRTQGIEIRAHVLPFGDPGTARAHTAWAADLLRTAGIEPQESEPCATVAAMRARLEHRPPTQVVVLCGLDDGNSSFVRGARAAIDGVTPRPLLYATGEPPRGSENWGAIGFLHRGLDPIGTLHGILDRLGVPPA